MIKTTQTNLTVKSVITAAHLFIDKIKKLPYSKVHNNNKIELEGSALLRCHFSGNSENCQSLKFKKG